MGKLKVFTKLIFDLKPMIYKQVVLFLIHVWVCNPQFIKYSLVIFIPSKVTDSCEEFQLGTSCALEIWFWMTFKFKILMNGFIFESSSKVLWEIWEFLGLSVAKY